MSESGQLSPSAEAAGVAAASAVTETEAAEAEAVQDAVVADAALTATETAAEAEATAEVAVEAAEDATAVSEASGAVAVEAAEVAAEAAEEAQTAVVTVESLNERISGLYEKQDALQALLSERLPAKETGPEIQEVEVGNSERNTEPAASAEESGSETPGTRKVRHGRRNRRR